MGMYNNRLFNKAVNCHCWCSGVCCPPPEGLLINPFGTVEQRVDPSEHVYTYLHVHVHVDEATPDHTTENCIIILNTAVTS